MSKKFGQTFPEPVDIVSKECRSVVYLGWFEELSTTCTPKTKAEEDPIV